MPTAPPIRPKPKRKPAFTPLWQTCALGYTPQSAVEEFVRNRFACDQPRLVLWTSDHTFKLMGGIRTYRIQFKPGNEAMPALYQIGMEPD